MNCKDFILFVNFMKDMDFSLTKINKFEENCGFIPFPGTLNIIIPENKQDTINNIKDNCNNLIKPNKDFGGVQYVKARLNDEITGAIIFPEKTTHEINYLEFMM